jgi:hypothetical protein
LTGRGPSLNAGDIRALSSAGERSLHTGEVVGSIPTAPTTKSSDLLGFSANHQNQLATVRDATKREHDGSNRGKSGDFDHRSFEMRVGARNALVRAKQGRAYD